MQPKPGDAEEAIETKGQASLLALVVSLVVLTTVMGAALAVVDGAYRSADREPTERRIATSLAERLVSEASVYTTRANVMNKTKLHTLSGQRLTRRYPFTRGVEIHIRAGDKTIVERGNPAGGTTVRRIILREQYQQVITSLDEDRTIPPDTQRATVTVPAHVSVRTIRANDHVVLHDPRGLTGSFEIAFTGSESTRLQATGGRTGAVTVRYRRKQTTPTELVVTVDV